MIPNLPIIPSDAIQIMRTALPAEWFPSDGSGAPFLNALLAGFSSQHSFISELVDYAQTQMRLQTATQENLDLFACDYFPGNLVRRKIGESDAHFRQRIKDNLFAPRATRTAMYNALWNALKDLSTNPIPPILIEPERPLDCGAYNEPTLLGYNIAGRYGSGQLAYQGFIEVFISPGNAMDSFAGYNVPNWGYSVVDPGSHGWYGSESLLDNGISDQDIYDIINITKVYGTICWTRITRGFTPQPDVPDILLDGNNEILLDGNNEPLWT